MLGDRNTEPTREGIDLSLLLQSLNHLDQGILVFDQGQKVRLFNSRVVEIYGFPKSLARVGATLEDIYRFNAEQGIFGPGDIEKLVRSRLERVSTYQSHTEERILPSGTILEIRRAPLPGGGFVATYTDVSEHYRSKHLKQSRTKILDMLANGAPLGNILDTLVLCAEDIVPGMAGSILILGDDERLHHGGAPFLPDAFNQAIDGVKLSDGLGPWATAAFCGKPFQISDFFEHQYGAAFKDLAKEGGVKAGWSQHIQSPAGQVIGTLTMYFQKLRTPTNWETEFIGAIGNLASIAIEQTRAEQMLRQSEQERGKSEQRLSFHFKQMPVANITWDLDFRVVDWNPMAEQIFGYSAEEALGCHAMELVVPEEIHDRVNDIYDHLLSQTGGFRSTNENVTKDGRRILCEWYNTPLIDDTGKVIGVASLADDVTERRHSEQALSESEQRFRQLVEQAADGFFLHDLKGDLIDVNHRACESLGYNREELLRMSVADIETSVDLETLKAKWNEMPAGTSVTFAGIHRRKNGTTFPVEINVGMFERGGQKLSLALARDNTERKQAEKALLAAKGEAEEANRTKSEFLALMSHDLRTPLNAILGFAEILTNQYFGPISDKYREYVDDIYSSGEHLLALVNEILDLSTIEAGKQSLYKEKLPALEIIIECEKFIEDKVLSNGITLITRLPADLPPLYADRRALKQILLNLLTNAAKFTPKGGKITVSAKASKKNTTLKIADTGMGISPEKLPKLTEPFGREDNDPYLAEPGWGLGLAITKSLVDLHDGRLDIKSKVGKGTTVTVTLPNETT